MKYIPNSVSIKLSRQMLKAQKHSPAIMFGAGIAVGITAAVKACQATLKVEEVLNKNDAQLQKFEATHAEQPKEYTLEDVKSDQRLQKIHLVRDLTTLYALPVGLGFVSVGLLTSAHVVLTRRNIALAAAYTVLDRSYREYRERVVNELGSDKDREFRYGSKEKEIVDETTDGHVVKTVKRADPGKGRSQYAVCFDQLNPNWQPRADYNQTFLTLIQTHCNQKLHARGHLFLNEVYEALGLEHTPDGQIVGWVLGGNGSTTAGDGYVDFGFMTPDTHEVYDFMRGDEGAVWLDFNVDGPVWNLI
jgi:hypothetical protein